MSEPSIAAENGRVNGNIPRSMSAPISTNSRAGHESSTEMTRVPDSDVSSRTDTVSVGIPIINGMHTAFCWVDHKIASMAFLFHNGRPLPASDIAQEILRELEWQCPHPKRTYTLDQMISRIYAERRKASGDVASMISRLEMLEYRFTSGENPQVFIHGNLTIPIINKTAKRKDQFLDRVIVFSHPCLHMHLKQNNVLLLVDATFVCVPRKPYFYQLLIIMAYISGLDLYIPVVYVLMTGKSQVLYEYAFDLVINMCGGLVRPQYISVDFEQALVNALRKKFPHAILIGCYFHFKQALRKQMQKLGFPRDVIKEAMIPGKLDLFRLVNPNDLHLVQDFLFEELNCLGPNEKEWEAFWIYMEKTWYPNHALFSVYKKVEDGYVLAQETNNVCESYNHRIQKTLGQHPDFMTFLSLLKEEAERQVLRVAQTNGGVRRPPRHEDIAEHRLPMDFINWLSDDPNLRFPSSVVMNYYEENLRAGSYADTMKPAEEKESSEVTGDDLRRMFEEYDLPPLPPLGVATVDPEPEPQSRAPAPFSPGRQPAAKKQNKRSTPKRKNSKTERRDATRSDDNIFEQPTQPEPEKPAVKNPYVSRSGRISKKKHITSL